MTYLSDFYGLPTLQAGQAIANKDLVVVGPGGKGFPAAYTDYAAIANAGASCVVQTSIVPGYLTYGRNAIVRDTDGSIFVAATDSVDNGCRIYRYSPTGGAPASLQISSAAEAVSPLLLLRLSNGNFVILYRTSALGLMFVVFNAALTIVKSQTVQTIATAGMNPSNAFDAVALSGGGFAITWRSEANQDQQKLAIYDNAGNAVFAPATIYTWAAAPQNSYHAITQLSNGNIAIAVNNITSSVGTYHAIFTSAGVQVLGMTQLSAVMAGSYVPEITASNGYYAIAVTDGANVKVWVLSNAGALQGAAYSAATTQVWTPGGNKVRLLADGTQFWLLFSMGNSVIVVIKVPFTGTNYVVTQTAIADQRFDAFIDNGLLIHVMMGSGAAVYNAVSVIELATMTTLNLAVGFGVLPTTNAGNFLTAIPVGDLSMAVVYDYSSPKGTYLAVVKYTDTAIIGVATSSAAVGAPVVLAKGAGSFQVNTLKGSPVKVFDHTTGTNIQGNKGTLMLNAVIAKGI